MREAVNLHPRDQRQPSSGHIPTVFVLLPVHNRSAITSKFVRCLAAQTYQRLNLVILDDGSTDGTAQMVREILPDAAIVMGDGSWWWSGCMQRGYEWLSRKCPDDDDVILFANDDITFSEDFVERGVDFLRKMPGVLLGARLLNKDGAVLETGVEADLWRFIFRTAGKAEKINCLPTRALFLRWGSMRQIGGFHPHLLPQYWADYEYTMRAHRLGMHCVTSNRVIILADMTTTGYHNLDALVGWQFLRRLFSIKTPLNPLYRTSFVLLASPWLWKPFSALNVWFRAAFRIIWQGLLLRPYPRKTATGSPASIREQDLRK